MITNAQEAADVLQKGIDSYKESFSHWEENSTRHVIEKDFRQLDEIHDDLEAGNVQKAWDTAYYLDTLVREEAIGVELWNWFLSTGLVAQYHGK